MGSYVQCFVALKGFSIKRLNRERKGSMSSFLWLASLIQPNLERAETDKHLTIFLMHKVQDDDISTKASWFLCQDEVHYKNKSLVNA
jgi:hypothetical protein